MDSNNSSKMRSRRLQWHLWATLLLCGVSLFLSHGASAISVDLSEPVLRNHVFLFGDYGNPAYNNGHSSGATATATTRYVQLSNGSRFVCDTTSSQHHDPRPQTDFSVSLEMQSVVNSIKEAGLPCTHVVERQYATVLCWDREVRRDKVQEQATRVLGRRNLSAFPDKVGEYWTGADSFGRYAATVYGDGDACPYEKRPTTTELRFYCRYTELENPIPFLTLHESSRCNYVLRVLSNRFCYVPQLDHAVETETVQCRLLD